MDDVWLRPVVSFAPIPGKIPVLPQEVVNDLSRDACLVYKLGLAVQTGVVPPDVAAATIGPPLHARWLTTGARDLRYSRFWGFKRVFTYQPGSVIFTKQVCEGSGYLGTV